MFVVSVVCCLRRADHSSRGVLPTVMRLDINVAVKPSVLI